MGKKEICGSLDSYFWIEEYSEWLTWHLLFRFCSFFCSSQLSSPWVPRTWRYQLKGIKTKVDLEPGGHTHRYIHWSPMTYYTYYNHYTHHVSAFPMDTGTHSLRNYTWSELSCTNLRWTSWSLWSLWNLLKPFETSSWFEAMIHCSRYLTLRTGPSSANGRLTTAESRG